jgi:pimeloyl-ACP methyl ester carboxylesterase
MGSQSHWYAPTPYQTTVNFAAADGDAFSNAEAQYAAAREADEAGNPICIDRYYSAAVQSWPCYVPVAATEERVAALYRAAVQGFIDSAAKYGRFNRVQGVLLSSGQFVPVGYYGFVWRPEDFDTLLPVGDYETTRLEKRYATSGVGVPYVVLAANPPRYAFTISHQPFAATAVIGPSAGVGGRFALQFYDPLRQVATDSGMPLARDLTAPLAYAASLENDDWIQNFLRPGSDDVLDGLHKYEPFQPQKIPVVFIHGLASDPLTWLQLENDLRAQPAILSRYQFWYFRYDTGSPFLGSAARLRQQLAIIHRVYDPARCNPNMSRIVLIGHSMGGLVAQLQVTYSGDTVWQAAAMQPFNTIITDPATRADLAAAFFFQPSPDVARVVYIATPHRGSGEASRLAGRISSALVEERPEWVTRREQLTRDNPCAFREEIRRRVPTSVDLLEPDSLILQSTERLPYRQGVALNTIIGDYRWANSFEPSDGVVSVESAGLNGGETEATVDARHTGVLRSPETSREVTCILLRHAGM